MSNAAAVVEVPLADLAADLARGAFNSQALTSSCLDRIAAIDHRIGSVLSLNPRALEESRAADGRRTRAQPNSRLDGIPILVKDSIDVAGLATTAGSFALKDNVAAADAPVTQALRKAGAVILGKANLSEWSNFRSLKSSSGWSAVGGLTRNPYDVERSACGSSSGSAAAVAASLVPAAIGTETDGSVVWPASICGVVGLKPTVGLMSQTGIVPISHEQDTAGPLARNVTDAAIVLGAMCGNRIDYAARLDPFSLRGARLGALRFLKNYGADSLAVFEQALQGLRDAGATIVDIDDFDMSPITDNLLPALLTEFKAGINRYLAGSHPNVSTRTLDALIAFNRAEPRELKWFGQELFEMAAECQAIDSPDYHRRRARLRATAGAEGIDYWARELGVTALLAPTNDPAWPITLGQGDTFGGAAGTLPAIAGYPHLTVPAGYVRGLPVGLSFIGQAGAEQSLLSLAFAFEQSGKVRVPPAI